MGGDGVMWKFVAAAFAWLCLCSAGNAAIGTVGGRSPTPQIFYNIVTDGGAVCQDNHVVVTRVTSIANGSAVLNVSVNTFTAGDVGKYIAVPGASGGAGTLIATIQTFNNPQQVVLNLTAGTALVSVSTALTYGTDDAPNFKTFNTWARANQGASNQVVLTIPSGRSCWFGTGQVISGTTDSNAFAWGVNNLIVEAAGATLTSLDGAGYTLGSNGVCFVGIASAGGCSARLQSISPGTSTVTLTSASVSSGYISRFSVGKWVMVGGLDTQSGYNVPYGDPPNNTFFEWRQIVSCNASPTICTGSTITLDRPLTKTYLSTWPLYNPGDAFHSDGGGPATIWTVSDGWNQTVEYRGLTISQAGQTNAKSRNTIYRNATFTGGHGAIPTENETWSCYSCDYTGTNMETDKLVGTMLMDTVTISELKFQSSSTYLFIGRNLNVTTDIFGSATNVDISDSTLTAWAPGSYAYGATTGYTKCTRCKVLSFIPNDGGIYQNTGTYSMSSGVISFANTEASGPGPAQRVFVPGGNVFYAANSYLTVGLYQAQALTQDVTNTYVQTNEAGGFPSVAGSSKFRTHPAPQFTCTTPDPASDPIFIAACTDAGATALAPLGTYSSRSYAPTSAQGKLGSLAVRGKIVDLTIVVTQAYSGSGSATLQVGGQFNNYQTIKQSDWNAYSWGPQIDLKTTGTRVISASGWTCNGSPGGCGADVITGAGSLPEAVWIPGDGDIGFPGIRPYMGSTLSAGTQPLFTMTLRTNQGVVP